MGEAGDREKATVGTQAAPPYLSFGTWRLPDCRSTVDIVKQAIVEAGYRHIDTAAHYENEASVGAAVRECGIDRASLFVTSKIRNSQRGYRTTLDDCRRALDVMGLDYLDLLLIHWPAPKRYFPDWEHINAETWAALEDLKGQGLVGDAGVSNFEIRHIEPLAKASGTVPSTIQTKLYPGIIGQKNDLLDYCRQHGILVEAYSPLCAGKALESEELARIAHAYGKSPAQICLRWCLQHNAMPVVKASSAQRMIENARVFDFEIGADDMDVLDDLSDVPKSLPNPDEVWRD